jgi:hypothetical protein
MSFPNARLWRSRRPVAGDRADLEVSRSVIVVPGGLSEKSTKTDRSRSVALDEVGVALLIQYQARVGEWAAEAGTTIADDAFVFSPHVDGATPFRPDNVTGFFIRVRDGLGLEGVRLHDLRHFTATQLGAGVDVRTVAGRLGHSDPSLTLRVYSHVIEERDRAAAILTCAGGGPKVLRESRPAPIRWAARRTSAVKDVGRRSDRLQPWLSGGASAVPGGVRSPPSPRIY